jgi:hypothetical protein
VSQTTTGSTKSASSNSQNSGDHASSALNILS